jgi:hypothetical protein
VAGQVIAGACELEREIRHFMMQAQVLKQPLL